MSYRGVPVEVDGDTIWFVPIEAGPVGHDKREALDRLFKVLNAESDDLAYVDQLCEALVAYAEALLVQNYSDKAREIAERIPAAYTEALIDVGMKARLPENFTGTQRAK